MIILFFAFCSNLEIVYELSEENNDCELEKIVDTVEECKRAAMELGIRFEDYGGWGYYQYPAGCFVMDPYTYWPGTTLSAFPASHHTIQFNGVLDPSKTEMYLQSKVFGVCRIQDHGMKSFLLKARGKYLRCAGTIELMLILNKYLR